ncbi:hypothetical protein B0B39_18475 (plasmid) [Legionella longbeachae]|uniref:hypothetical protein n=1 Tax=Legionella longbeachae TaxID=450 RepID=UPI000A1C0A57|nr:hypothetical protein [Legionella longbeachae]ARM35520.1 hypothetical protein B0B39_18475 [Legionella longbeachae]
MKILLIVICLLGFSLPVFSATTLDGRVIVYCPEYIKCDADQKLDSCHLSNNEYNLWHIGEYKGNIAKGVYHLNTVLSTYDRPVVGKGSCRYSYIDKNGVVKEIFSSFIPSLNKLYTVSNAFGAYLGNSSQWNVVGWDAECIANDPKLCPLVEYPGIYYGKTWVNENIYFNIGMTISSQFTYDQLLNLCGDTSVCNVGIASYVESDRSITPRGSVKVDLTVPDKVTIVDVYSNSPSLWKFKKNKIFNIISNDKKN